MEKIDVTGLPPEVKEYISSLENAVSEQQRQIDQIVSREVRNLGNPEIN